MASSGPSDRTCSSTPRAVTGVVSNIHAISGIVVGTFIVAMGVHYLLGRGVLGGSIELPLIGSLLGRVQQRLVTRVDVWVGDTRIVGLGEAHGLLPYPLLYPAFIYAFVQGSPVGGMVALGPGRSPRCSSTGRSFSRTVSNAGSCCTTSLASASWYSSTFRSSTAWRSSASPHPRCRSPTTSRCE